jgi:ubiquinone/menaquinone biosynthesis methyltransferase
MSGTYGVVNLISSFGFCIRWRRRCVGFLPLQAGDRVFDLMTGMGELCPQLAKRVGPTGSITAVDLSPEMCKAARRKMEGRLPVPVDVLEADALELSLPDASADAVVSCFGLKTFSHDQTEVLAAQVARLLRPGGVFSFLEISVPRTGLLRGWFSFYLNRIILVIGKLFMGNPANYRMLGIYTSAFGDCANAKTAFDRAGLNVTAKSLFFGCATAVFGSKPGG